MTREKILKLIRETAALRRDLLAHGIEEGSLTVELSNRDLSAIVYALACTWISEYVNGLEGHEEMRQLISGASDTILAADCGPQIDRAIDQILGRQNPEVEGDGA